MAYLATFSKKTVAINDETLLWDRCQCSCVNDVAHHSHSFSSDGDILKDVVAECQV